MVRINKWSDHWLYGMIFLLDCFVDFLILFVISCDSCWRWDFERYNIIKSVSEKRWFLNQLKYIGIGIEWFILKCKEL